MLCHVADGIFWMSRYVERVISLGRLIEVTWHLELDAGEDDGVWARLLPAPPLARAGANGGGGPPSDAEVRHYLAFDRSNPGSIVSCVRRAREAARGVRESISTEMWEQINTLHLWLAQHADPAGEAEKSPHAFHKRVREGAQLFQGLCDCTMAHDEAWQFIRLGRSLERADNTARLLGVQAHLLRGESGRGDEAVRWLAVLRSCGSAEAYARYYALRVEPARVVEFLLFNPVFPQSVRFCVEEAWDALQAIAGGRTEEGGVATAAVRALGLLRARTAFTAVDEVLAEGLEAYLQDVAARIRAVSDRVSEELLQVGPTRDRATGVDRAARMMAAQQQQSRVRPCG